MKPVDEITINVVRDGKNFGHRYRWTKAIALVGRLTLESQLKQAVKTFVAKMKSEEK